MGRNAIRFLQERQVPVDPRFLEPLVESEAVLHRELAERRQRVREMCEECGLLQADVWYLERSCRIASPASLEGIKRVEGLLARQLSLRNQIIALIKKQRRAIEELRDTEREFLEHTFRTDAMWERAAEELGWLQGLMLRLVETIHLWRMGVTRPVPFMWKGLAFPQQLVLDMSSICNGPLRFLRQRGLGDARHNPLLGHLPPRVLPEPALRKGYALERPKYPSTGPALPLAPSHRLNVWGCIAGTTDHCGVRADGQRKRETPRRASLVVATRGRMHEAHQSERSPQPVWSPCTPAMAGPHRPGASAPLDEKIRWAEEYLCGEEIRQAVVLHETVCLAREGKYLPTLPWAPDCGEGPPSTVPLVRPPPDVARDILRAARSALRRLLAPPRLSATEKMLLEYDTPEASRQLQAALRWHHDRAFRCALLTRCTARRRLRRGWESLTGYLKWREIRRVAASQLSVHRELRRLAHFWWQLQRFRKIKRRQQRLGALAKEFARKNAMALVSYYMGKLSRLVIRRHRLYRQTALCELKMQNHHIILMRRYYPRLGTWARWKQQLNRILKGSFFDLRYRYWTRLALWPVLVQLPDHASKWACSRLERRTAHRVRCAFFARWMRWCDEKRRHSIMVGADLALGYKAFKMWLEHFYSRRRLVVTLQKAGRAMRARIHASQTVRLMMAQTNLVCRVLSTKELAVRRRKSSYRRQYLLPSLMALPSVAAMAKKLVVLGWAASILSEEEREGSRRKQLEIFGEQSMQRASMCAMSDEDGFDDELGQRCITETSLDTPTEMAMEVGTVESGAEQEQSAGGDDAEVSSPTASGDYMAIGAGDGKAGAEGGRQGDGADANAVAEDRPLSMYRVPFEEGEPEETEGSLHVIPLRTPTSPGILRRSDQASSDTEVKRKTVVFLGGEEESCPSPQIERVHKVLSSIPVSPVTTMRPLVVGHLATPLLVVEPFTDFVADPEASASNDHSKEGIDSNARWVSSFNDHQRGSVPRSTDRRRSGEWQAEGSPVLPMASSPRRDSDGSSRARFDRSWSESQDWVLEQWANPLYHRRGSIASSGTERKTSDESYERRITLPVRKASESTEDYLPDPPPGEEVIPDDDSTARRERRAHMDMLIQYRFGGT